MDCTIELEKTPLPSAILQDALGHQQYMADDRSTQQQEFARSLPARVRLHVYSPLRRVQAVGLKSTRFAKVLDPVNMLIAAVVAGTRLSL